MFYKTALLGKRVQEYLKKIVELSAAERSDILFYLLYGVVASALGKNKINFPDIKKIDILKGATKDNKDNHSAFLIRIVSLGEKEHQANSIEPGRTPVNNHRRLFFLIAVFFLLLGLLFKILSISN